MPTQDRRPEQAGVSKAGEPLLVPQKVRNELARISLGAAKFIHDHQIKSVFCIEAGGRLPGHFVLQAFSALYPNERPPGFFFHCQGQSAAAWPFNSPPGAKNDVRGQA